MQWGPVEKKLRALWPGVDPYEVMDVLSDWAERDPAAVDATLEEALALPGPSAATRLMEPVAATLATRKPSEHTKVFHALDALVRAGGDPTRVLPAAAQALSERRTMQPAARLLRRAALRQWSLASIDDQLPPSLADNDHSDVRHLHRLAELQRRGRIAALRGLAEVYDALRPMGDLHDGLALVEESLLSEQTTDDDAAQRTLAELSGAGSDPYRCWLALLPVLAHHLRGAPRQQREAAKALSKLDVVARRAEGHAVAELWPRLEPVVAALGELLATDESAVAAEVARTLRIFVDRGGSLGPARARVEAALDHEHVTVRSECSRGLSAWLQREGREAPLPAGRSHRRVWAASDEPLQGQRPARCPACDYEHALVVYRHEDIGQTHADILIELRCPQCGVFSEQRTGY